MDAIHKMSDPSTFSGESLPPNNFEEPTFVGWLSYVVELPWVQGWMLNPAGEVYPFVEFGDLSPDDTESMVGRWLYDRAKAGFCDSEDRVVAMDVLTRERSFETAMTPDDLTVKIKQAMTTAVQRRLVRGRLWASPVPACDGHLMASEREAVRADRLAVSRRFEFDSEEPFNAYTMLYGKKIAKGGDMITGCTVTDGVAKEFRDFEGRTRVRYYGHGVTF